MLYTNLRNAACEAGKVRKEMPCHFGSWTRQLLCSWTEGSVSNVTSLVFSLYTYSGFPPPDGATCDRKILSQAFKLVFLSP